MRKRRLKPLIARSRAPPNYAVGKLAEDLKACEKKLTPSRTCFIVAPLLGT
jgi:hypothetical protein